MSLSRPAIPPMPSAFCPCSIATSLVPAPRRGKPPLMAAMPAVPISLPPRPAASPMSPSTKSAGSPLPTWSKARRCTAGCATSVPGSRPGSPASNASMAPRAAPGAGSTTSKPTSGRLRWPTIWCCSPASNWHSRSASPSGSSRQISLTGATRNPIPPALATTKTRKHLRSRRNRSVLGLATSLKTRSLWTGTRLGAPLGARFVEQLLKDLVGLGADNAIACSHKRRHAGDAVLVRLSPIGIDGIFKTALGQHGTRLLRGQSDRRRELHQYLKVADVARVDEIGLVQGVVEGLTTGLGVGPFAELLSEPAVVGVRPPAVGQPFGVHQPLHAGIHRLGIDVSPRIKLRHRAAFHRGLGMEREVDQGRVDLERLLQLFNTHGTEIAPGSDVVGKDLQLDRLGHEVPP